MVVRLLNLKIMKRSLAALLGATTLTLGLTACAEGGSNDSPADDGKISVVASTSIYGDLAKALTDGNDKVEVTSILSSTNDDPHEFEPTARNIAQIRSADLVAANGAGYDNWLTDNVNESVPMVTAAPLAEAHTHDHGNHDHAEDEHNHDASGSEEDSGANHSGHNHGAAFADDPHMWMDMDKVNELAEGLAEELHKLDDSFPEDAESITSKTQDFTERVDQLPARNYMLTEPVASHLLGESSLHDVTPSGFAEAVAKESEPSATDIAAAQKEIYDGHVDFLVTNTQSQTAASQELIRAAEEKNIPVVNINETPDSGDDYFDYVNHFIKDLEKATE